MCCDLPWHDRAGGKYRGATPGTEAWSWANVLARAPRGKNGFFFSDLLCELREDELLLDARSLPRSILNLTAEEVFTAGSLARARAL
eukprot:502449-Prymnesium_polylepis.1